MDILSILGVVIAFLAVVGGVLVEGGSLGWLIQGPAFVIVGGGIIGTALLQNKIEVFLRGLKMLTWVFFPPKINLEAEVERMVEYAHIARRDGVLGLENYVDLQKDAFAKKGLQLVADGTEPGPIRETLEVDIVIHEENGMAAAKVFESVGGYSPTFGIIGAVLGLIHTMQNLSDQVALGKGIATAFVATVYGVGFANLFLLPIANKLLYIVGEQRRARELFLEGVVAVAQGENPRNIETKLLGFLEGREQRKVS